MNKNQGPRHKTKQKNLRNETKQNEVKKITFLNSALNEPILSVHFVHEKRKKTKLGEK
jgi:hypothetical protein